jgi:hypothetical protein
MTTNPRRDSSARVPIHATTCEDREVEWPGRDVPA